MNKFFTTKYPTTCFYCKKELPLGSTAMRIKGTYSVRYHYNKLAHRRQRVVGLSCHTRGGGRRLA